jgi:hypothetical protein
MIAMRWPIVLLAMPWRMSLVGMRRRMVLLAMRRLVLFGLRVRQVFVDMVRYARGMSGRGGSGPAESARPQCKT